MGISGFPALEGVGLCALGAVRMGLILIEASCPACGIERAAPMEALGEQSIFVCLECGWVQVWEQNRLRVPTALELDMLAGFPPVAVEIAKGATERQKRIMASGNAS